MEGAGLLTSLATQRIINCRPLSELKESQSGESSSCRRGFPFEANDAAGKSYCELKCWIFLKSLQHKDLNGHLF